MTVKSWVVNRAHRAGGLVGRGDLPPREPALNAEPRGGDEPGAGPRDAGPAKSEHLGAYAGLIGAVRAELEHFVASHVRLHLAIAERDRFLLTSIRVECTDAARERQLLREFLHEFKPEQVKRYLAREVIGGLPNAAAIDLTQFAGLVDASDAVREEAGEYGELLEALRSTPIGSAPPAYEVSVIGRWAEPDAVRPAVPARASAGPVAHPRGPERDAAPTPLAGARWEFELEDSGGKRRVVLQAVVPGRRYVVGKAETCEIRVDATYASRRHAEVWLEDGSWWAADAGSTNGIRVEPAGATREPAGTGEQPLALAEGARLVLSARAHGPAAEYPWIALAPAQHAASRITPIAASWIAAPRTPLTAVVPGRPAAPAFALTVAAGSASRTIELRPGALPASVGRSRSQTLVIDRSHEGVSGHHLDVVDIDAEGVEVEVHGDNGVLLDAAHHGPGARFRWLPGETLVLGGSPPGVPPCRLTLSRAR